VKGIRKDGVIIGIPEKSDEAGYKNKKGKKNERPYYFLVEFELFTKNGYPE